MQSSSSPITPIPNSTVFNALSVWKAAVVAGIFWASAFVLGYTLNLVIPDTGSFNTSAIIPLLISLVVFLVGADMVVILFRRMDIISGCLAGAGVFLVVGLLPSQISFLLIFAGLAAILLFVWAGFLGHRVSERLITVHVTVVSRAVITKMMVGVSVFIALVFFNIFSLAPLGADNPIVPQAWFESAAEHFSRVLAPILGNVDLSLSLRDIALSSVETSLSQQGVAASPSLTNDLVEKTVNDAQTRIVKIVGEPIDDTQPLAGALYAVLLNKFNSLDKPVQRVVLGALAFILFLSVQVLSPIIRGVVGLLSALVFTMLRVSGFVSVLNQPKQQEVVVLS